MVKRLLLFILIILASIMPAYTNERTEALLDRAIEEFSRENYEEALSIIDMVLIEEPDNNIAKMYKKTIEDVAELDKVEDMQTSGDNNNGSINSSDNGNKNDSDDIESASEIISLTSYIGSTTDKDLIFEQGLKIILGIPLVELKLRSNPIDYDVNTIFDQPPPFSELISYDNYCFDIGIGARYHPFNKLAANGGYFDFKLGATNFSIDVDKVVPYVGFDSEVRIFCMLGDNLIFNNFWIGGRGNLYFYDDNLTNNYIIEGKVGMRAGFLNIGAFYGVSKMESIEYTTEYNQTYVGLLLGLNF